MKMLRAFALILLGGVLLSPAVALGLRVVSGYEVHTMSVTTGWTFDESSNGAIVLAAGANAVLPAGSGMVLLTNYNDGSTAVYIVGGTGAALVSATGTSWVAPTTSPASGKNSLAWNGAAYALYSAPGATFGAMSFRTRASN